ncbi:gamma-glutamylcyclotransferase [Pseudoroseomonas globiformis]|uniref:glutathione-specific gamma-glutamylcyclotransferase n=1 Tax=Teichococcus globiformis TaxID=2307229 RepID=A0ABV7G4K5_9PROT
MDDAPAPPPLRTISRETLRDGSLMAAVRATPGLILRSEAEMQATLDDALAARPSSAPVWVFGYGSLMWNPSFHFAERRRATLHGWQRRFCLWLRAGRGTVEQPGLMLALDRGGSTHGVAFRLEEGTEREELGLVWMREMVVVGYLATWVTLETEEGPMAAITFTADHAQAAYAAELSDEESAACIAAAHGPIGSNAEYLAQTAGQLDEMGLHDEGLERIRRLVAERSAA